MSEEFKNCYQCKKMLHINQFYENNKTYTRCNSCREMINNSKEKQYIFQSLSFKQAN